MTTRVRRSRRRSGLPRPRTLESRYASTRAEHRRLLLQRGELAAELAITRPRTRGECWDQPRPCPWVGCRHHLYLEVDPNTGSIKFNRPDLQPWELTETCALDVAERGGQTLDEVGQLLNVTRERTRQIEVHGLLRLRRLGAAAGLR